MENEKKSLSPITQTICLVLAFVIIFLAGNMIGAFTKDSDSTDSNDTTGQSVVVVNPQPVVSTTVPQATSATTQPTSQSSASEDPAVTTTKAADPQQAPSSAGVPTSKAEIIALFNESANKVKTDAVKVVKNYEYRSNIEDKLIMPSALEGMANSLMSTAMKDDLEPIEYATKEEIAENYMVPGQSWVSQLTEAEVMEATCTDNGTEYEVMLKLHPTVDPEPGIGVAKAFDTITAAEVREKAPSIVQSFSTEYYDCVVKCKIDKETGYTTWANYTSPLVLKVVVKMFGTLDAQIGLCFEKDYTITY